MTVILSPRYYYDDKAIDGFIAFCENEMTLVDGNLFAYFRFIQAMGRIPSFVVLFRRKSDEIHS